LRLSGHNFARFSKSHRLVRGPFGGPAASVTIHLVARVLGELHGKALAAEPQHLDTGIDQRLRSSARCSGGRPRRMSHESWAAGSGALAPQRHTPPSPSSRNATVTMSGVVFMMCAKTSPKRRARSRFTSMGVRNVELKVRHCLIFLGIEATVRIYIAGIISSEFQTLTKEFPECGTAPLFTLTFSMQHFNRESDSLAAKRDQAAPQPVAAHRMDQLGRQHCTGRANRMAMGHGTAFDIDDVLG